jgi:AcrR family transcriptional regulator
MTRSPPRRTVVRLPREQRVQDILAAAEAVFSERGYENAAMSEIAARAGVVEGTIYKYFENKRDLVFKVMEAWYDGLVRNFATELAGIAGTRPRLRYLVWRHLRTVHDAPELCRVFFREVRTEDNYHRSLIHEMNRRYTRFVTDVLQEGIDRGELRADTPVVLVRDLVFGGIEHHMWNYVYGRGEVDVDAAADAITDLVLAGLRAGAPAGDAQAHETLVHETRRLAAVTDRLERLARPRRASGR